MFNILSYLIIKFWYLFNGPGITLLENAVPDLSPVKILDYFLKSREKKSKDERLTFLV